MNAESFTFLRAPLTVLLATLLLATPACDKQSGESDAAGDNGTDITHVDVIAASQLLAGNTGVIVLDVRTPEEHAEGHLPGTVVNVDFKAADFKDKAAELDRATTYLVHCRSGKRSTASLEVFKELGFEKIYHLDGGINAWREGGEAVEK